MRKLRLILGVGLLATMLTIGAVACEDDEDNGNGGDETPAATEPADETPADDGDAGDETPMDDTEEDSTE